MLNSIKKYSKTFFFKVLVGIIILPFLFWGMGDVFSGGSQNVVAKIDSEKISARDFVNYLRVLNLNDQERQDLAKTDLIERILSDYIGKRVLSLELKNLNVKISDLTLRDIIKNDKIFFKDKKFSRTEYEKFLITNNLTAPLFETNVAQQEKKRQLLSYLSDGIVIPDFLVQNEFNKENQVKKIDFINLKKFYDKPIPENKYAEIFNNNKDFYSDTFKNFNIAEITPNNLLGVEEYNETFFNKINEIENKVLDNNKFNDLIKTYNLNGKTTGLINTDFNKTNSVKKTTIDNEVLKNLLKINKKNITEFININQKFYITELIEISKKNKDIYSKDVRDSIKAQVVIENKIKENGKLAKEISSKKFTRTQMSIFAEKNNLEIQSTTLKDLKKDNIFGVGVIKRIFETEDKSINLITDNMLRDNFIIYSKETNLPRISKEDKKYNQYRLKAKLRLANEIYNIYDLSLNKKYKVEINDKTLSRIKNSF